MKPKMTKINAAGTLGSPLLPFDIDEEVVSGFGADVHNTINPLKIDKNKPSLTNHGLKLPIELDL